jgi:phenylpyruvate tautomerase PptA (4-oxalocrotonate tautomerase family)
MPLIHVTTSADVPDERARNALLEDLSRRLASHLGKPETYVMTCLTPRAWMTFAGTEAPACYVEVKSIGVMTPEQTRAMSADFCARLSATLGVSADRIYIEFQDADRHLWGFNGHTFA